jgi:predicted nucleic acid-binding protein
MRPARITDLCLVALAVRRSGVLVTFDRDIAIETVSGAEAAHVVVLARPKLLPAHGSALIP